MKSHGVGRWSSKEIRLPAPDEAAARSPPATERLDLSAPGKQRPSSSSSRVLVEVSLNSINGRKCNLARYVK